MASLPSVPTTIEPKMGTNSTGGWGPVLAVALCTFLVVTSEMMPVGVLTPMASSLEISAGLAGMSLTITGIVAAVVSTLAPVLAGRADRRTVIIVFMLVLSGSNALTALAPTFWVLAIARVLLGMSMGIVWGLAAGLGPRLAQRGRVALATTLIFSGVSIASVLGVPLGTFVADAFGWRATFWVLAVLGVVSARLLVVLLPSLPANHNGRLGAVFGVMRNRGVAAGIIITGLVALAHFTGYTYVRPILESETGMDPAGIATALLVYGIAGVIGNFTLGPLAGRATRPAARSAWGGGAPATLALALGGGSAAVPALVILVVWGLGYGGVSASTQTWTAKADPERVEASAALWAGVFNASVALGAVLGGLVIDGSDARTATGVAAIIALTAFVLAAATRPTKRASMIDA